MRNIGLGIRDNRWDEIEAIGSVLSSWDDSKSLLSGFTVGAIPATTLCRCGDSKFISRKFCPTCEFLDRQQRDARRREYWDRVAWNKEQRDARRRRWHTYLTEVANRRAIEDIGRRATRAYFDFTRQWGGTIYRACHRPQSFYVGDNSTWHVLTEAKVVEIRNKYAPIPGRSTYALAREYGVSSATIYQVVTGSTWKHVGGKIVSPFDQR